MNTEEYGRMFAVEDSHWWYRALHAHVRNALRRHAPGARIVVDIGCGTGAMAAQLGDGTTVIGLDVAAEALSFCRRRGLGKLGRADAAHLPIQRGAADAVLLLDVLYHRSVPEPEAVLREARRVLASGGIAVINVPAYAWLRSSHDDAVHTGRRFTRPQMVRLLEEAGFDVVRVRYWNTMIFPAIAAVRLLRRRWRPAGSDVSERTPAFLGAVLGGIMGVERAAMRWVALPYGLSIFVVAQSRD